MVRIVVEKCASEAKAEVQATFSFIGQLMANSYSVAW